MRQHSFFAYLFLLFSLIPALGLAQQGNALNALPGDSQILDSVFQTMKRMELSHYRCSSRNANEPVRMLSNASFEKLYARAARRIMFGSQDAAREGRTASLDFNETRKKIGLNYNWFSNYYKATNVGFEVEDASSKLFTLFGKDGWKQGISATISQTRKIGPATILFMPSDCQDLARQRQIRYHALLNQLNAALSLSQVQVAELNRRKQQLETFYIVDTSTRTGLPDTLTSSQLRQLALWEQLDKIRLDLTRDSLRQALIEKENAWIEETKTKRYGYAIHWLNYGATIAYRQFKIYDTAVVRLAEIKKRELGRFNAFLSYNYFRESAKGSLLYFMAETSLGNSNFLEEILPQQIDTLKSTTLSNDDKIGQPVDALVTKNYDQLRAGYAVFGLGTTINYFPSFGSTVKRHLGFEFAANARFKIGEIAGVPARDVFTLRGGLLFAFEKDKVSKTTVALLAEFKDIPFKNTAIDKRFNIGVRIGVPFNY